MHPNAPLRPRLQMLRDTLTTNPRSSPDEHPEAVVGALLLDTPSHGLETLLIQRPERYDDPWSGHVSFPGGRVKTSDGSPRAALRREVMEEVGIDLAVDGHELGPLTLGRPGRNPELKVQPWVYGLKAKPSVNTNDEVEEAFWATLPDLPSKLTKRQVEIRGKRWAVDCFLIDEHIVWGFTFKVLGELMQIPEVMTRS